MLTIVKLFEYINTTKVYTKMPKLYNIIIKIYLILLKSRLKFNMNTIYIYI